MLVRDRMSAPPITVDVNSSIREARAIMRHFDIRRVPVLRRKQLAGILSWTDLIRAQSPHATASEIPWFGLRARVDEFMTPDPVTIEAESPIERAAVLMRARKVGGLPVLDGGALCGIITESDIFDAFVELTGVRHGGSRFLVDITGKRHSLCHMVAVLEATGVTLNSLETYEQDNRQLVILRTETASSPQAAEALRANGYPILQHDDRWQNGIPAIFQRAAPSGTAPST